MRNISQLVVVAILLLCLPTQAQDSISFPNAPAQDRQPPFAVGIVKANGNLLPIATFDGVVWSEINLWEERESGRSTKSMLKSMEEWTLWYADPGPSPESRDIALAWIDRLSPVRIGITADDVVEVDFSEDSCLDGTALVLATDAEDRSKSLLIDCDNCCPKPKRGIATTAESRPHLTERVDPESESGRRILARITDTFNELEQKELEGIRHYKITFDAKTGESTTHYSGKTLAEHMDSLLSAEKRKRLPFHPYLKDIFRVEGINAAYYYIEVARSYYPHFKSDYWGYGKFQGWVRFDDDEPVWLTQHFLMTDPDSKQGDSVRPIVFWRHRNAVDLLFRRSYWEGGDHLILRIDNDTVKELAGVGL